MSGDGRERTTARWRDVFAQFERIVSLPEDRQRAALDEVAQATPDLYPQLLTLLNADRAANSANFMGSPPIERLHGAGDVGIGDVAELAGQTIGAYRMLRPIGTGGMGQVWLAERADGRFEGQVAIKLLRSFGDEVTAKRFEREGHFLGRLQHPNIARLLDAGALANGQLYLVLEYVDGQRIDRAFDVSKLGVQQRIERFLPVCDAIAHAHANLVVHRDIKPSNVLVSREGVAKVLDFGVAKLLEDRFEGDGEQAELTQLAGRAFTPEFAAPEQIRGDAVSTQTDVYSLGILLYRLLSGRTPHESNTGRERSDAQYMKRVLEAEAPLMSVALARRMELDDAVLLAREQTRERLCTALSGDLDTIVAKAIKIAPDERYRSVAEFSDDLQRYLRHEPIAARADSKLYLVKKFARRHRVGVAATTAIAVSVVAGIWGTLSQANLASERATIAQANAERALRFEQAARAEAERATRGEAEAKAQAERAATSERDAVVAADSAKANEFLANEQRRIAERFRTSAEREAQNAKTAATVAQKEAAKASSVKDFMIELFNAGNINLPDAEARELKVATTRLLNRGTERLKTQLIDQPDVRSELIDTVANLHLSIESPDQAEFLYREQLAMIEKAGRQDSTDAAASWMKIGQSLRNQRKYKEAEEAQLRALAILDRIGDKTSETRGSTLLELVRMSFWMNTAVANRDIHLVRANESIAILGKSPKSSALSEAWYAKGRIHEASGSFLEAAGAYERGIAAAITALSDRHAAVAGGRQMRARVLGYEGRFAEALRELQSAQKQFEATVGEAHRYSVDIRAEIAELMHQLGESSAAIAMMRRALDEQRKLRGGSHNLPLRTQRLLAEALYDTGQTEEAVTLFRDALERSRKSETPSRLYEARVSSVLGRALLQRGDLTEAKAALVDAQTTFRAQNDRYGIGTTTLDLALLHAAVGEREQAIVGTEEASAVLKPLKGKLRNDYWRARTEQARLAAQPARGELLLAALTELRGEPEAAGYRRAEMRLLEALANSQVASGASADACSVLASAIALRERLDGAGNASATELRARKVQICG